MMAAQFDLIKADVNGHTLIEASAGTGKTYTLAMLYVRLLLERSLSVRQILVVTFTKAATAELRTRILKFLQDLLALFSANAPLDIDSNLQQLHAKFAHKDAKNRLILAIHGFDEAAIYTIHSFCQRALSDNAFEAASDFSNELVSDDNEFITQVMQDLWRSEAINFDLLCSDYLITKKITPQSLQSEIKAHLGKPYLKVMPEPKIGTFKLEDQQLTKFREVWLKAKKMWLERCDLWRQTLDEYLKAKKFDGRKIQARYLDSWFAITNDFFTEELPNFAYAEKMSKIVANNIAAATKSPNLPPSDPLSFTLQNLGDELQNLKQALEQTLAAFKAKILAQTNIELPKLKAQKRVLAFDDLINSLAKALSEKGGEQLATSLRTRFPLALIDEFQDTDPAQYQIFSAIYPQQENASLCLVGDPKQAIYAFRSADFATYVQARSRVLQRYSLTTNYRTSSNLIAALNYLFASKNPFADANLDYPPAKSSEDVRRKLVLPPEFGAASCTLVRLSSDYLEGSKAGELAAIDTAITVAKLLAAGRGGSAYFVDLDGNKQNLSNSDIAILVADHNQAKLIGEHLTAQKVDWVRQAKDSVFKSPEATELINVLKAYLNAQNEGTLRLALASSFLGKNAQDLQNLSLDNDAFEQEFNAAANYAKMWQQRGFLVMFRHWLQNEQVAIRLLKLNDGERRLTNLLHLGQLLQLEALKRKNPAALLLWFENQCAENSHNETSELRLESDASRVTIATIHAAKGLEYNLVFCPFLWSGKPFGSKDKAVKSYTKEGEPLLDFGSDDHLQHKKLAEEQDFAEKMRLLYVALTRAKERLWLHFALADCTITKNTKELSKKNGLHYSSLGFLLYARDCARDHLSNLHQHFKTHNSEELNQELESLILKSGGVISLQDLQDIEQKIDLPPNPPQILQVASFARNLQPSWQVTSFSRLAPHEPHSLPLGIGEGILAFPKGANAGNCLHYLFEHWAKGQTLDLAFTAQALKRYNFEPDLWSEIVFNHLQQVLAAKLQANSNLSLNSLAANERFAELDFTFSLNNLDAAKLAETLANPKFGLNSSFIEAAKKLDFAQIQGFMRGFIDLTFCYQNVWYIADYKSNWLGASLEFYDAANLTAAMAREHYYLQALIYSVALRRFLHLRQIKASFGGTFYLFLRGMPQAGVYFANFNDALLAELDRLFG